MQRCSTSLVSPLSARSQWNIALSPFHSWAGPEERVPWGAGASSAAAEWRPTGSDPDEPRHLQVRPYSGAVSASVPQNRCNNPSNVSLHVVLRPLQAVVGGERQPAWVSGEGEHGEEEAEHEQRGTAVAPPDQPPHVAGLVATAPLLLHLPRPLLAPFPALLLPVQHTCGSLRLTHSLPGLRPDASVWLTFPQGWSQSQSLIQSSHAHAQSRQQPELLPRPGHAHTQSVGQSLQPGGLPQLFAEMSSHLFYFLVVYLFVYFPCEHDCKFCKIVAQIRVDSVVKTSCIGRPKSQQQWRDRYTWSSTLSPCLRQNKLYPSFCILKLASHS